MAYANAGASDWGLRRLTASSVMRSDFSTVRRGFDPDEVMAHLGRVAEHVADLEGRLRDLEAQLGEREQRDRDRPAEPDPYQVVSSRVADLLRTFEQDVERVRMDAESEADRVVSDAKSEAKRIRTEARREADQLLSTLSTRRDTLLDDIRRMRAAVARTMEALDGVLERTRDGDVVVLHDTQSGDTSWAGASSEGQSIEGIGEERRRPFS